MGNPWLRITKSISIDEILIDGEISIDGWSGPFRRSGCVKERSEFPDRMI